MKKKEFNLKYVTNINVWEIEEVENILKDYGIAYEFEPGATDIDGNVINAKKLYIGAQADKMKVFELINKERSEEDGL